MRATSPATRRSSVVGALSVVLAVVPAQAEELRVCLLENDLPRASRADATGFDHDLFREAADRLDRVFVPVWRPDAPFYSEIEDSELPLDDLAAGECDLVPSVPGSIALGRLAEAIDLSPPYYAAAFEIYMPSTDHVEWSGLAETVAGRKVAVRLQSLAHFAVQWAGLDWTSQTTAAAVAAAVDDGQAVAALIWGPALGRLQKEPVHGFEPPAGLRFNEHAAMRSGDDLVAEIGRALDELRRDGTLQRLANRYGIFRIEPFTTVSSPAAIRALNASGE